jgi:hypothetical protein
MGSSAQERGGGLAVPVVIVAVYVTLCVLGTVIGGPFGEFWGGAAPWVAVGLALAIAAAWWSSRKGR